jgi:asparagine synthase (glutamine-hydrolysing)
VSGIVGIVNLDGAPVDGELLAQLTRSLAFRGPDHQNLWQAGAVGFGHTLLRTTVESNTERGVASLDGQVWITADVRLDGRRALIARLGAEGHAPAAAANDVTLLLHAYACWGEAALDHLIGDFAFAIWDARRQRLFCAHDHFGVVPFYYARVKNCLVFSNTLNTVRLHPAVSPRLNAQTVGDFLLFMMNMDLATTTFADIQRLPPAHSLVCADGAVTVQPYFHLPAAQDNVQPNRPEEYVEQFQGLFDQAVADRLRTEKAGAYLSGGMDSSSIAVTAHKFLRESGKPYDFRAYTLVCEQLHHDEEGYYAGLVAQQSEIPLEYLPVERFLQTPPAAHPISLLSEPSLIASQAAELDIVARVARYSRVLFAGYGGDPAFELAAGPRGQAGALLGPLGRMIGNPYRLQSAVRAHWRRWRGQRSASLGFPAWLQPAFVTQQALRERWQAQSKAQPVRGRHGMFCAPVWSHIFAASDPGATAFPLRFRFPFFDLRLVQYLATIPPAPWLEQKTLLRIAMQARLPAAVYQRPKTRLRGHPQYVLAQQRGVQDWMSALLANPALNEYVDGARWRATMQATAALTPGLVYQLNSVLTFAHWLHHQDRGLSQAVNGVTDGSDLSMFTTFVPFQEMIYGQPTN